MHLYIDFFIFIFLNSYSHASKLSRFKTNSFQTHEPNKPFFFFCILSVLKKKKTLFCVFFIFQNKKKNFKNCNQTCPICLLAISHNYYIPYKIQQLIFILKDIYNQVFTSPFGFNIYNYKNKFILRGFSIRNNLYLA